MPVRSIHIKHPSPHPPPSPPPPLPSHSPRPGTATTRWRPILPGLFQESFTFVPSRGSLFTNAWTNSSGPMCLSRSCTGKEEESEERGGVGRDTRGEAARVPSGGQVWQEWARFPSLLLSGALWPLHLHRTPCVWGKVSSFPFPRTKEGLAVALERAASPAPTPRHVGPQWEIPST